MSEPALKASRTESSAAAASSSHAKQRKDAVDRTSGPFSVLETAMQTGTKIIVRCRFDRLLTASVKAYDQHFNMLLTDVTEIKQDADEETSQRALGTVVIRGDSVVFVVKLQ
eukprot:CAMPEP_0176432524 /NCGR_PEP_ID=MMETSP0127-20121128/15445_1 /TAXON_ID=938130 /ORGANISM="Platyophrya macrostoma, Strain WH" /LENGTH=111 /DNA_ID=CAMNT_0017814711 /DNA_START=44 /DNA_END=379 /DNA_ORIENTATION=+